MAADGNGKAANGSGGPATNGLPCPSNAQPTDAIIAAHCQGLLLYSNVI